jgi:hypothetical protein
MVECVDRAVSSSWLGRVQYLHHDLARSGDRPKQELLNRRVFSTLYKVAAYVIARLGEAISPVSTEGLLRRSGCLETPGECWGFRCLAQCQAESGGAFFQVLTLTFLGEAFICFAA